MYAIRSYYEPHPVFRYSHFTQCEIFCDREILAVTTVRCQHLQWGGPVVFLSPVIDVVDKFKFVEEIIDLFEFRHLVEMAIGGNQFIPEENSLSCIVSILLFYA